MGNRYNCSNNKHRTNTLELRLYRTPVLQRAIQHLKKNLIHILQHSMNKNSFLMSNIIYFLFLISLRECKILNYYEDVRCFWDIQVL